MFDTSSFDRALKKRREKQDRERTECLRSVTATLIRIRDEYDICEAYVTGALLFEHSWNRTSHVAMAVGGCSMRVLDVMKVLEDASGRTVDVIDLDMHPFPESVRNWSLMVYQ
jgi:hypothetical protein